MIDVYLQIQRPTVPEASSFDLTAYFRTANVGTVPTTARYRIDSISTGNNVRAWTDLTPAESITIPITPDDTAMSTLDRQERKQITVEINQGLDTQVRRSIDFKVDNIRAF